MSKKKKRTKTTPTSVLPRQQQTPIESKSSEELALLLGDQYKLIMQCDSNIRIIKGVLEQRRTQLAIREKEAADGKQGN